MARLSAPIETHWERADQLVEAIQENHDRADRLVRCRAEFNARLKGDELVGRLAATEDAFFEEYGEDDSSSEDRYEDMELVYSRNEFEKGEFVQRCLRKASVRG